jgi:hypothetical protein
VVVGSKRPLIIVGYMAQYKKGENKATSTCTILCLYTALYIGYSTVHETGERTWMEAGRLHAARAEEREWRALLGDELSAALDAPRSDTPHLQCPPPRTRARQPGSEPLSSFFNSPPLLNQARLNRISSEFYMH